MIREVSTLSPSFSLVVERAGRPVCTVERRRRLALVVLQVRVQIPALAASRLAGGWACYRVCRQLLRSSRRQAGRRPDAAPCRCSGDSPAVVAQDVAPCERDAQGSLLEAVVLHRAAWRRNAPRIQRTADHVLHHRVCHRRRVAQLGRGLRVSSHICGEGQKEPPTPAPRSPFGRATARAAVPRAERAHRKDARGAHVVAMDGLRPHAGLGEHARVHHPRQLLLRLHLKL
jgi:hypothetical protein